MAIKSKSVKKQLDPKKCVNYMDIPVCPECGSPNLQSLGEKEGKKYWVCTRCYTPCWTDDSFNMGFGADNLRFEASTKKMSKMTKGLMARKRGAQALIRKFIEYGRMSKTQKSKIAKDYNGWSNYETWNYMLWHSDYITENITYSIQEGEFEDEEQVKDAIEGYIDSDKDLLYEEAGNLDGFLRDVTGMAIGEIDVYECVRAIWADVESAWNEYMESQDEEGDDYEASTKKSKDIKKDYDSNWQKLYDEKYDEAYNEFSMDNVNIEWGYNPVCELSLSYDGGLESVDIDSVDFDMQMEDYFNAPEDCFENLSRDIEYYAESEFEELRKDYADAVAEAYADENAEDDEDDDDYDASAKKIHKAKVRAKYTKLAKMRKMKKSKYSEIHKRLNKIGGFTKEDEDAEVEIEVDVDDDDAEVEVEDKDKIDEFVKGRNGCKGCKSRKSVKRMKMRKAEEMPEDADDQQDQNEKGSGNAGSELPEDADDNQDQNEKGSGNAKNVLPEDADEQENIKESARKKRMKNVRKFSVTPGGQPNQDSYNGRYQQAPMVRDAIDGQFGSKASKSYDEVGMMQERIDDLMKSRRNPSSNNGVPKRLR